MANEENEVANAAAVGAPLSAGDFVVCKVGNNEIITTQAGCMNLGGMVVGKGGARMSPSLSIAAPVTCRLNGIDFVTSASDCELVGGTIQSTDP
jgi:hypothetical protein